MTQSDLPSDPLADSMADPLADAVTAGQLRSAFAYWASGVAIVTALDGVGKPIGVTVNSLISVSLEPPLLLWSIGGHAPEYQAFCDCSEFAVHMLSADQQELSNRFADPGADKFAGRHWQPDTRGLPSLSGVLVRMTCVVEQSHTAGDHRLLIGRVQTVVTHESHGEVLVYCNGAYRQLA